MEKMTIPTTIAMTTATMIGVTMSEWSFPSLLGVVPNVLAGVERASAHACCDVMLPGLGSADDRFGVKARPSIVAEANGERGQLSNLCRREGLSDAVRCRLDFCSEEAHD